MRLRPHDKTFSQPLIPVVFFFIALMHVGAVAALFFFTWSALLVAIFLWWVAGSLGIGMCYHRLLTHRGYKTYKWVEYVLTLCATLALQGGPIGWVATHRKHHQTSDTEEDPHSPIDGGFWAHIGWVITGEPNHNRTTELLPYVPDLRKDKFHLWISKWHWVPLVVLAIVLFAVGGWPFLLWGIFFRTTTNIHFTFLVNSATHMWGSQRFKTGDNSTNNFIVAMLTFGEGWHNNHHADPLAARHGLTWYEIDTNWWGICALRALGLAWDVKMPRYRKAPRPQPSAKPASVLPDIVPDPSRLAAMAQQAAPIGDQVSPSA